ncbi:hypothetical protein OJ997_00685 [Solirubrobacter phytolaccae]|uniref:Uncharacterized protein n=1 Tax=Solirubrobacter phytolaccae TaxID=1404360 RepID=A0A9X3N5T5_9ACTN|nr:hypothetical protein [Solirubrobacter phytolaccae]MDA0178794.1 hypothetical protein [Solirubrobacter phytolaccae]
MAAMTWAHFEEKEFEVAAAVELSHAPSGPGYVFSSGQVLEELLGYDAAVAPPIGHVVWRVLGVRRPRGVVLIRSLWELGRRPPASRLPTVPVSLVVQYKRPEHLRGARAKQWGLWHAPYFRFTTAPRQQAVLLRLHKQLGADALVRYASPAFWSQGDLEAAIVSRSVLTQTGFVGPDRLAGHRVWTYVGPGQDGLANPTGRRTRFESFDDLRSARERSAVPPPVGGELVLRQSVESHLKRVAAAAREREPQLRRSVVRWAGDLQREVPELGPTQREAIVDLATIVTVVAAYGASWHLI